MIKASAYHRSYPRKFQYSAKGSGCHEGRASVGMAGRVWSSLDDDLSVKDGHKNDNPFKEYYDIQLDILYKISGLDSGGLVQEIIFRDEPSDCLRHWKQNTGVMTHSSNAFIYLFGFALSKRVGSSIFDQKTQPCIKVSAYPPRVWPGLQKWNTYMVPSASLKDKIAPTKPEKYSL